MRKSGILMHISSLPGPYGIGTMGRRAFDFVDFLERAGQHSWQILPLTPTGYGDSPYQSCSAYAGNHYLIDLDRLAEEGLLTKQELDSICWCDSETRVDFGRLYDNRLTILGKAYGRFTGGEEFEAFLRGSESWLPDYALFMALKGQHGGKAWYDWEPGLKFRKPEALAQAKGELARELRFWEFVQFLFHRQWTELRSYAKTKGIEIIGDVPIYVPYDSVEVWKDPQLFQLDDTLTPTAVAGCPPDSFNEDGQLWGNPIYRWDAMESRRFDWWLDRLRAAGRLYDVIRMDHFRGFASYWSIPYGDATARNGRWIPGPGLGFIQAVKEGLPELRFIAEDLGYLTQEVIDLRGASGFPGMKVLQFAFDSREPSEYLPHTYSHDSVCYTGTHDNTTMQGWFDDVDEGTLAYAREYMCLNEYEGLVWGSVRMAMSSVSDLCVVQMQDYLELDGTSRMNAPGTISGANWTWRASEDFINENLAKRILALTRLYGRAYDNP